MNLKEFAKAIGMSQTTVSRALSGYPEVKQETRQKILKLAQELGYHPNRSAAGLATGRAGAVGIVLREGRGFDPNTTEFMAGLANRLETRQIDILISVVEDRQQELAAYQRLAGSKRVDAIILHTPTVDDERMDVLKKLKIPFIVHGRGADGGDYPWLDIDNYGAIYRATSYLLDIGHRHIGMINGSRGDVFAEHREQGYRNALKERGIVFRSDLLTSGAFIDDVGYRSMQDFLSLSEPPTAVLAGSMMTALGVMRAVRSAGLQLGADVSLIAHDDVFNYINADNMVPTVSTTRSSMRDAGVRIGDILLQMLAGRDMSGHREIWPVELVLRESTRPPRK
ncbi:substrate-binding domain-containing protein [Rhizobium sp. KVB221]|uniref:Substrate-binding domain-containing protein n=1 Tax=Rhizobium setariae TaxID=2801340 RepID=A0A937CPC5_9HYPH|nr:substrate-binding domain-containing protein [Rhizobium setariae]MBL0371647.1 substrate-binding domain-containing protein [Rhizobium setariae]